MALENVFGEAVQESRFIFTQPPAVFKLHVLSLQGASEILWKTKLACGPAACGVSDGSLP